MYNLRKLQAPRSAPVCGATCGIARVHWLCWQHFRTFQACYGTMPLGSRFLYELLPLYSSSFRHRAFYPAFYPTRRLLASRIWRNARQQKTLTRPACMLQQFRSTPHSPKRRGWSRLVPLPAAIPSSDETGRYARISPVAILTGSVSLRASRMSAAGFGNTRPITPHHAR